MRIIFWKTKAGRHPVMDFIKEQHPMAAQRVMKDINHLEEQGLNLAINPSKVKSLQGYKKLYELKTHFKGTGYRTIFATVHGDAWLLESFKKKGNATPQRHIDTALNRQASII